MDLLKRIVKWLEDKKIYQRERKSNKQRALGMLLYNACLSYKKAGMFAGASTQLYLLDQEAQSSDYLAILNAG